MVLVLKYYMMTVHTYYSTVYIITVHDPVCVRVQVRSSGKIVLGSLDDINCFNDLQPHTIYFTTSCDVCVHVVPVEFFLFIQIFFCEIRGDGHHIDSRN